MSLGTLWVVTAPSGAGKTTLMRALVESVDRLVVSVSHTTRAPRVGEVEGCDYFFVSVEEFEGMLARGVFWEHAQVFGNYYGTARDSVLAKLAEGVDVILEIDWQGAAQVRALYPEGKSIFIVPPSRDILEVRLRRRGKDTAAVIERRLAESVEEMKHYVEFDYLVVNDHFETALADLQAIIRAQRLMQVRQAVRYRELLLDLGADSEKLTGIGEK